MPLEVRRITAESDFPELVRILNAAFGPERSTGMAALTAISQESTEDVETCISQHVNAWRTYPDANYVKVIDTDLDGQMIAAAAWRINEEERTEAQMQSLLPVPGEDEEGNQAAQDFTWHVHHARKEFMGTRPFCFLHLLFTDPAHERRGAGTLLLEWGIAMADQAHLPCLVEATEDGKGLYVRHGFKTRHVEYFDLTKYGGEGTDTSSIMIRDPVASS